MKNPPPHLTRSAAFTLIELLTVIGIIAVLMTLLFPAINAVKDNAARMDAKNTCMQIVTAVKQYYQEYGKFPPVEEAPASPTRGGQAKDTVVGDPGFNAPLPNNALFHTLRAIDKAPNTGHKFNRRKIIFFEGRNVASVTDGKPRKGFYDRTKDGGIPDPTQDGALFDPWGMQYGVVLDTNYDNRIDLTQYYSDFSGADPSSGLAPRATVGAFSTGKDRKLGSRGDRIYKSPQKTSDDVVSWQ